MWAEREEHAGVGGPFFAVQLRGSDAAGQLPWCAAGGAVGHVPCTCVLLYV